VAYTHLLFDHDGVLVNTEPLYLQAIQEQLATLKITLAEADYIQNMAVGADPWKPARQAGCDEAAVHQLRLARDKRYQELLRSRPIRIAGADAVVAELAAHFNMAIVTTSRDEDFDLIHGLDGGPKTTHTPDVVRHMDFVLKRSDYRNSKPDPEPYLLALSRFDIDPETALVVEDSERGLRSAVAAGIDCAAIYHPFTAAQNFAKARYGFANLQALRQFLLS
jgi:beta-phosphoglucomutase-like phosphatase (HAD superfamily)